jgi:mRNA interferase MazF
MPPVVRDGRIELLEAKVRPAAVVSRPCPAGDVLVVPLTSKTTSLMPGESVPGTWSAAASHVPTAAKRGVFAAHHSLIAAVVRRLAAADRHRLEQSPRTWLRLG